MAVDFHDPQDDERRYAAQRQQIVDRLLVGPATTLELSAIALRFGARVHELRRRGFEIESKRLGGGLWLYRLIPEPKQLELLAGLDALAQVGLIPRG